MHSSSFTKMRDFAARYLDPAHPCHVVDVGSMDVNGSYRSIFDYPGWRYTGLDMAPGPNVDVVLSDIYVWRELIDGSVDVVVSGQALEHIEFFWLTFQEIARVLRPGGLACIIAPSRGPEHRYPVDCWRFYPDGFAALARWSGLELLEATTAWPTRWFKRSSDMWGDTKGVFRKPLGQTRA